MIMPINILSFNRQMIPIWFNLNWITQLYTPKYCYVIYHSYTLLFQYSYYINVINCYTQKHGEAQVQTLEFFVCYLQQLRELRPTWGQPSDSDWWLWDDSRSGTTNRMVETCWNPINHGIHHLYPSMNWCGISPPSTVVRQFWISSVLVIKPRGLFWIATTQDPLLSDLSWSLAGASLCRIPSFSWRCSHNIHGFFTEHLHGWIKQMIKHGMNVALAGYEHVVLHRFIDLCPW